MKVHAPRANSIAAYHQEEPKLSKRAEALYAWILEHGPHTDREVMKGMGFTEPNAVRPRITELLLAGRLMEVGDVVCSTSNKRVRRVDISKPRLS